MSINIKKLELSTQIIIKEAQRRDLSVEILDYESNFIRLSKNGKKEYVMQATKTSLDTYIVPLIMENKKVTKIILSENLLNVPLGVEVKSVDEGMQNINKFFMGGIVIKPNSTNFGKGITIMKNFSQEDYIKGLAYAFKYDDSVLIEKFIEGKEYRFLTIGDEVAAILHRVPANVLGDGKSTIKQLVDKKNEDPLRGVGYITPLEKIKLEEIEIDFIKKQGYDSSSIINEDQVVYLRENSNISTGGDSIDYTDDIINDYKEIALKASRAVGAKICGLDIIIKDIKAPPSKDNYSIIEMNFNPALHIHNFPYKGINRHVDKKILDLLGFVDNTIS